MSQDSFVASAELALYVSVEDDDPHTRLVDLLCHLRHWAEGTEVDFEVASREAEFHYSVERHDPHAAEVPQDAAK